MTEQHTTLKQIPQRIQADKQAVPQKNLEEGLEDIYKGK